ncbi:peptidylprolyl isomerase [Gemmatimonas phototrophica]|uniref:Peptidyl-prolyl cis-trans isomerase n=2 Tax=Gemmatimonas phototrophica TaxID=1379270 RepID=A0A143BNY1_9BACT|nr:peptidylprolyl isomerase [Gemmatimonas phototrophica]
MPPTACIDTEYGTITLQLFAREAPLVVEAFTRLAQQGKYRNTTFHRVVPNFVVQDGDITNGTGDPEPFFSLRESWSRQRHGRGCLGLATAGPDTGGSQYYMCHSTQPHLDGGYTVFGRVVDGFDVMDRLVQGDMMLQVRVP